VEEFGTVMEEIKRDESPKGKLGSILKLVDIVDKHHKELGVVASRGTAGFSVEEIKELVRFAFVVAYTELGVTMVDQHREEAQELMNDANLYASTIAAEPLMRMTGLSAEVLGRIMNTKEID
jgi:hypothetical protein